MAEKKILKLLAVFRNKKPEDRPMETKSFPYLGRVLELTLVLSPELTLEIDYDTIVNPEYISAILKDCRILCCKVIGK